jgi:nicotinate-nucleotide adenylyltransferase
MPRRARACLPAIAPSPGEPQPPPHQAAQPPAAASPLDPQHPAASSARSRAWDRGTGEGSTAAAGGRAADPTWEPGAPDASRATLEAHGAAAARPAAAAIALLGTSADPPTHGHRALLEELLRHYPAVATWASDNPQKRHRAPLALRQALLAALVEAIGDPRLQLVQELSSPWTEETLARAGRLWPQRQPVFVVGSDLVDQIPRWRHASRWLPGCRLAVVPRRGWALAAGALERLRQLGAKPELLKLDVPASASSGARAAADPGEVPEALWPLLRKHDPYGFFPRRCGSPSPSSTP